VKSKRGNPETQPTLGTERKQAKSKPQQIFIIETTVSSLP